MSGSGRTKTRREGRWQYGEHPSLNPGWRLLGTNLVLDFDPLSGAASIPGCYMLWIDGQEREPIDHYLDGAMDYVERHRAEFEPAAGPVPPCSKEHR